MKTRVMTGWLIGVVVLAGAPAPSWGGVIVGYELNESADLGDGGHGFYNHGSTWDSGESAPGGYSSESLSCRPPGESGDRFISVVGSVDDGGSAVSWVCWLRLDSSIWVSSAHTYVYEGSVGNYYDPVPGEFLLYVQDGSRCVQFSYGKASGEGSIVSDSGIGMDGWVHVAVVFDGGDLELYLDGQPAAATVVTGESSVPECAGREIRLGGAANRDEQWLGWIDEWAMLDVGLSQGQVQYIMAHGLVAFEALPPEPEQCGDEGTQYQLADINQDCYVNMLDLAAMVQEWLD